MAMHQQTTAIKIRLVLHSLRISVFLARRESECDGNAPYLCYWYSEAYMLGSVAESVTG
jgi:hypothetical protein